jgi:hypothetical protein
MLVGSVAKGVQTKAECPVLVIPALSCKSGPAGKSTIELAHA